LIKYLNIDKIKYMLNFIKIFFLSNSLFLFISCFTFYEEQNYEVDKEELINESTITLYQRIITPTSPCTPFIDIHDEHKYSFILTLKKMMILI